MKHPISLEMPFRSYKKFENNHRLKMSSLSKNERKKEKQKLTFKRDQLVKTIMRYIPECKKPFDYDQSKGLSYFALHIASWMKALDQDDLRYWDFLTNVEKRKYLFEQSELAQSITQQQRRLCLEISVKKKIRIKKNDEKMPIKLEDREETRKIVRSIKDKIKRSKNESWDYNKTDWDVT
jgi:hypothetical protein